MGIIEQRIIELKKTASEQLKRLNDAIMSDQKIALQNAYRRDYKETLLLIDTNEKILHARSQK